MDTTGMVNGDVIADLKRDIAELKDQLADQSLLKAEILRLGQNNKKLEDYLLWAHLWNHFEEWLLLEADNGD